MKKWMLLLGLLIGAFSVVADAPAVLSEWSGAAAKNVPRNVGFYVDEGSGAKATLSYDSNIVSAAGTGAMTLKIEALAAKPAGRNIQMWFMYPKGVEAGKTYRISLLIKANRRLSLKPRVIQDGGSYSAVGEPGETEVALGTEWTNFVFEFVANDGFHDKPVRVTTLGGLGVLEPGTIISIAAWKLEELDTPKAVAATAATMPDAPFTLAANGFVQWYQLGDEVKFTLKKGNIPASMQSLTGKICDVKGRPVDSVTVDKATFAANGWSWKPARAGYYEIVFEYRVADSPEPAAVTES